MLHLFPSSTSSVGQGTKSKRVFQLQWVWQREQTRASLVPYSIQRNHIVSACMLGNAANSSETNWSVALSIAAITGVRTDEIEEGF